jgi:hypothetical protein
MIFPSRNPFIAFFGILNKILCELRHSQTAPDIEADSMPLGSVTDHRPVRFPRQNIDAFPLRVLFPNWNGFLLLVYYLSRHRIDSTGVDRLF